MDNRWLRENLTELVKSDDNIMGKCPDIAKDIIGNKLKLIHLVESLGDVLTDKDPLIRCQGTDILAEVLVNFPKDFLIESELHFVTAFFLDRLADHHSVTPAVLKGILTVVQMEHVPPDTAKRVVHSIFQHVGCQTLKPEDRRKVYQIFQYLMHNFTSDLRSLGPDFVYGVMNAIDQEKDAQNLMIVFRMVPFFVTTFPLGHLKEEMFEIVSCYFPVDYRPDYSNCSVSRENLSEALQTCLVASPDFGEFCLPLLVEKLDSKLKLAKLDSFKVLISGCDVFPYEIIRTYLLDLWRIVQHEILPGSDKEIRELGLASLQAIVRKMARAAEDLQNPMVLKSITQFVLNAGIHSLGEVELNLFLPAVRMMLTVAAASAASCTEVSQKVIPVLVQQFFRENEKEQKVTVLRALTSFVAVCDSQKVLLNDGSDPLREEMSSLFLGAAQSEHPEVRREGFHGLAVAAKGVDQSTRYSVYDLLRTSLTEEAHSPVREEILVCLKEFSKMYSNEVLQKIVEVKLRDLEAWPAGGGEEVRLVLQSLCCIADEDPFTPLVILYILQLVTHSSSSEKCKVGAKCLRDLLESGPKAKVFSYVYFECDIVARLVLWGLQEVTGEKCSVVLENEEIWCDIAKILNLVVRNQESSIQTEVALTIVPKILKSDNNGQNGCTFDLQSSSKQNLKVILLEAVLSSIRLDVKLPDLHCVLLDVVALALSSSVPRTQRSACRLAANLVNKASDDEQLLKLVNEISSKAQSILSENSSSDVERLNAASLMVWITKALVMRGHSLMELWINNLIMLMAEPLIGCKVAQGFSLILNEDEENLNLHSFCNIRILYRQRFFTFTPKLLASFYEAPSEGKVNFLIALGHMLQGVPQEVLIMDLEKMVPLLVESLQQADEALLLTTLDTLLSVLQKSTVALQHHLQTFIPRVLCLAQFPSSMRVRIKAVQCINQFYSCPTELILPFKSQVLKVLGECLDDDKRLVRKEVVQARARWFIVGSNRRRL